MSQNVLNSLVHRLTQTVRPSPAGECTDGELLGRFIDQSDEPAFAALLKRHGPMVFGVCRRLLQDTHAAEDAFQMTFLVLARRAASIVPRECVAAWLHGVAWRTAQKARSVAQRQRVREGTPLQACPEPQGPCVNTWTDLRLVIDAELSRLPEPFRAAIVLCDLEGLSRSEAACRLEVSEGTLSSRLARGRDLLRGPLQRRGVTLSATALASLLAENAQAAVTPSCLNVTLLAALRHAAGRACSITSSAALAMLLSAVVLVAWGAAAAIGPANSHHVPASGLHAPVPPARLTPADLLREAREQADRIKDPDRRASALLPIAETQLRSGDRVGTCKTLRDIAELVKYETAILEHIPRLQKEVGDLAEARKNAAEALRRVRLLKGTSYRVSRLSYVAETLILIGEVETGRKAFEEAVAAARSTKEGPARDSMLSSVTSLQIRCGEYEGARKVIGFFSQRKDYHKKHVLSSIAARQAEQGNLKAAQQTLKELGQEPAWVRRQAAEGLARQGKVKEAAELAEPISDRVDRAYAFMAIAAAQVERGDRKGTLKSLARAMAR